MFCAIRLSKSDPTPLYIQLANELSRLIESGAIPSKTKLPTIRTLSSKLKINRDTVVSAYKLLETSGLVIAHVGSGTYVAPNTLNTPHLNNEQNISCSSVAFSKDLFPVNMCKELISHILDTEGWSAFCDPLYRERNLIKQSIGTFLESVGISSSPAEIRLINDMCNFLVDLLKVSSRTAICVEEYRDLTLTSFIRSLGFKIYEIPVCSDGLDLNILEKHLKTSNVSYIWVSSYIQNPTGICYSDENKIHLLELAKKYDCYIIEDGTYNDFAYNNYTLSPLHSFPHQDRVIFLHHFSKVYLPHLSYSFAALPPSLIKRVPDKLECTLNERVIHYYLESDYFGNIRQQIISSSYTKYNLVLNHLLNYPHFFHIYCPKGGLFFWIKPIDISLSDLCTIFIENNIIISPGDLFSTLNSVDYFRLSISSLSDEQIHKLIHTLKQIKGSATT
ncbi:MAG: PLP-dependent aminotransferase family protein [Cellulosilyticaceae bacterium]